MKFRVLIASILFVCCLLPDIGIAQNKVVVIPLLEEIEASIEPWAPVAADSSPTSAYSIGTEAVRDTVTGLYWQKEDDNTERSWDGAWDYCQNLSLWVGGTAGFTATDWRLPTADELMSLVDYGTHTPAINGSAFPGTNSLFYWSATTNAFSSSYAWGVVFSNGNVFNNSKSIPYYVRCVRGLPVRDSLFKNNGNGTVTDLATGLTWQREDDNDTKEWAEAGTYCNELSLAGGGWRLPTAKELNSIVDDRVYGLSIDTGAFPGTNSSLYWSATTTANDSGLAWSVNFYGRGVENSYKSNANYVRCVR